MRIRAARALFSVLAALVLPASALAGGAGASAAPASPAHPASPAASGATSLRVSPTSGPPGTVVHVTGHRPGGPTAATAAADVGLRDATICWGPCTTSLTFDVPIHWSATHAGDFSTEFTVPTVPWLTLQGPHAVTPGTYAVGLQCLAPMAPGCATRGADASAPFRLTGRASGACLPAAACARLQVAPAAARPGATVHVRGWAPLTPVIGQPFGYELWLTGLPAAAAPAGSGGAVLLGQVNQAADGALSGSFALPSAIPGGGALPPGRYRLQLRYLFNGAVNLSPSLSASMKQASVAGATIRLAGAALRVAAAPTWAALGAIHPVALTRNTAVMGQDPMNPSRLAYCAPAGGIRVSADAGSSWSTVSTASAAAALRGSGYALFGSAGAAGPACTGVVLDPAHPGSLYATFTAASAKYGAPPMFSLGLWTDDSGATWHLVPAPSAYSIGGFGGFQTQGASVVALFGRQSPPRGGGPVRLQWTAERAADGGTSWTAASLNCPAGGPCLRWGPAPNGLGSCAMSGAPQPLLRSTDGGRRWSVLAGVTPNWCNLVQLVALGPHEAALISGNSSAGYPFRLSTDGGTTWQDVALPALPGQAASAPEQFPGLQMLPDGTLWAAEGVQEGSRFVQRAMLLAPGAHSWCAAGTALPAAMNPSDTQALGGRLWTFVPAATYVAAGAPPVPSATSVPLQDLHCAARGGE